MPIVLLILHLILVFFMGPCPPPAQMDTNWFVTVRRFGYGDLPAGVSMRQLDSRLMIANASATPLYLLGPGQGEDAYDIPVKVPGLIPQYMFVNKEVYAWLPDKGGWIYQGSPSYLMDFYGIVDDAQILAHIPRNTDRPANVSIPEPISTKIYLVYDAQITDLVMHTTFALNPTYMYKPPAVSECSLQAQRINTAATVVIIFIFITGFGILFYWSLGRTGMSTKKLPIGCGIVVALAWVVIMGDAFWAYQASKQTHDSIYKPCDTDPPHYPNRMVAESPPREFPVVTTDATAQMLDFYYHFDPRELEAPFELNRTDLNMSRYLAHFSQPSCAIWYMVVEIYDYGLFRIATVYYVPLNQPPTR